MFPVAIEKGYSPSLSLFKDIVSTRLYTLTQVSTRKLCWQLLDIDIFTSLKCTQDIHVAIDGAEELCAKDLLKVNVQNSPLETGTRLSRALLCYSCNQSLTMKRPQETKLC